VGATSSFDAVGSNSSDGVYRFRYDIQINNVREEEVSIVRHSWSRFEHHADGRVRSLPELTGTGLGGFSRLGPHRLAGPASVRYQGVLELGTPTGTAEGFFVLQIAKSFHDAPRRDLFVRIGRFGLSKNDEPVVPRAAI